MSGEREDVDPPDLGDVVRRIDMLPDLSGCFADPPDLGDVVRQVVAPQPFSTAIGPSGSARARLSRDPVEFAYLYLSHASVTDPDPIPLRPRTPSPVDLADCWLGLEWEPQVTLLNRPRIAIGFYPQDNWLRWGVYDMTPLGSHVDLALSPINGRARIAVIPTPPGTLHTSLDAAMMNLEIRSRPAPWGEWPVALAEAEADLQAIIKHLAAHLGPTGVFLPRSTIHIIAQGLDLSMPNPSKHVNLSHPDNGLIIPEDRSEGGVGWKSGVHHKRRLHIRAPYDFTAYETLIDVASGRVSAPAPTTMAAPILLGYSMNGGTYVQRRALF